MATQVFVSPGVYTSEQDLTFVTRNVGVTTLGLVGETTQGPAFQPIFIDNYGNFQSFFGGLNATKVKATGFPQYELPYIAKSYLSQSNQLFVTRVLGFTGYYAGLAWGITLDANVDPSSVVETQTGATHNPFITYAITSGGSVTITSTDLNVTSVIGDAVAGPVLAADLAYLSTAATGTTTNIGIIYKKTGTSFSGFSGTVYVVSSTTVNGTITVATTGTTTYFSGTAYTAVENQIVAILRSRGTVDNTTQFPVFEVTGATGVIFDPAYSAATANPLAAFSLSGNSTIQGNFDYTVSMDNTQRNFITKVLGRGAQDGKTALFVEEFHDNMFLTLNAAGKIRGIKQTVINYNEIFSNYQQQYQPATTPWIVSEVNGNKVSRLFRFVTISDGNSANEQIKISIANIDPDTLTFDVQIRSFYDTDARPVILEGYSKCTMDPTSNNYIARKIGTVDGVYVSNSSYVLIEMDDTTDTSSSFPAGFVGYPIRGYTGNSNSTVVAPKLTYNQTYGTFYNKRKIYLGLSDTLGIDSDFFDYKGVPTSGQIAWTGMTNGFHMDVDASGVTIANVTEILSGTTTYSPVFLFDTGNWQFRTDAGLIGGPYEKVYARKFTFAPYGGFDGWDIYNTRRTNTDNFLVNGSAGIAGLTSGAFAHRTLSSGDIAINSDYYAFLEGIWTFQNPRAVNINVFATPGIDNFDNQNLVTAAIDMVEQDRADSIYIMTTPDTDYYGNLLDIQNDVVPTLDGMFDSNYSATYWPWIQINDAENNVLVFVPPTRDVVRNIALTDNIAFPWYAVAGYQRGNVDCIQARKKLTQADADLLYENRINPIASYTGDGVKIWGNKTLQVADTALNRVNVRRLLLQARKLISAVGLRLLFDQDDSIVRNQFLGLVNPILNNIRSERGLTDFRVVLSNSPEDMDKNQLTGQIFIIPTRSLEFIEIDFVVMNTGASFANV